MICNNEDFHYKLADRCSLVGSPAMSLALSTACVTIADLCHSGALRRGSQRILYSWMFPCLNAIFRSSYFLDVFEL